jgi:hypothetical protein
MIQNLEPEQRQIEEALAVLRRLHETRRGPAARTPPDPEKPEPEDDASHRGAGQKGKGRG